MSFVEKFNAISIRVENNQPLRRFCQVKLGKTLTVMKVFKDKTEIDIDELPVVMLTRAGINRTFKGNISSKDHSVFLYAGFYAEDRLKAPEISIEFEELLENAVMTKTTHVNDKPMAIMPADSTNDEGKFHPVFFFVMEVMVRDR